jgi:chemotaxis response regulator CheB
VVDLLKEAGAVRIGIVNDLPLARLALRRAVQSVPGYEVAWQAADGAEAVRRAREDPADVILMDLVMPVMDGVEATRRIMQEGPCPILVVTVSVDANFNLVCEAMSHGGLDAVNTPTLAGGEVRGGEALLARLARIEKEKGRAAGVALAQPASVCALPPVRGKPSLLALGASTGGPEALARVLEALPASFPAPVVVVQHIAAEFAGNLVAWLQGRCKLPVRAAPEGEVAPQGVISVAATDDHLVMRNGMRFGIVREPADYPFRPSVDVFFESLAMAWPGTGVAVLLTGMGDDGARGLATLRQAGWFTLAQDRSTSVVYGMPKAAAELHAASRVLPLAQMPAVILGRFEGA